MLIDLAYGISAVLIALSFLAILGMFVASGVMLWRLVAQTLRQRREAEALFRRFDAELALRKP